ncbi:hypothetical protein DYBT9275_04297 [Dyadobacter sp. CECT 9275]|uniref:Uncharacterized protein n=1 Tax=Dyadobacter helix TaxID=2822344 RepID=A0A916JEZ0_9BACT|nr:hypothetical protein [Dyadobacter sp. CECT 9275]CAG5008540.1 hypothetical protein DYBT9275_04297 [Dyadobacter sp. CECT 9275]
MEQNFDHLKRIRRVNVPPFLFTRIENKIAGLSQAPLQWKWAFALSAIFITGLNIGLVLKTTGWVPAGLGELVTTMHLSTSNTLYDE